MRLSSQRSVADSFSSMPLETLGAGTDLNLKDGSRVAVIGGGPAGSFFTYFLLKMAEEIDLDLEVDIFEPRFLLALWTLRLQPLRRHRFRVSGADSRY